jgi:hypothetical protein
MHGCTIGNFSKVASRDLSFAVCGWLPPHLVCCPLRGAGWDGCCVGRCAGPAGVCAVALGRELSHGTISVFATAMSTVLPGLLNSLGYELVV